MTALIGSDLVDQIGMAGVRYDAMPIPLDRSCTTFLTAGPVIFGVEMRAISDAILDAAYAGNADAAAIINDAKPATDVEDGGVSIHVIDPDGEIERIRFDCFDDDPHYHYLVPEAGNQRYMHYDPVASGDMLEWVLRTLEHQLALMLAAVGATDLAAQVATADLSGPVAEVRRMAVATRAGG
jgi:hypothetical protein